MGRERGVPEGERDRDRDRQGTRGGGREGEWARGWMATSLSTLLRSVSCHNFVVPSLPLKQARACLLSIDYHHKFPEDSKSTANPAVLQPAIMAEMRAIWKKGQPRRNSWCTTAEARAQRLAKRARELRYAGTGL